MSTNYIVEMNDGSRVLIPAETSREADLIGTNLARSVPGWFVIAVSIEAPEVSKKPIIHIDKINQEAA